MTELEPHELFPTMPPIIALFAVEVSGPKYNPWGRKNKFNSSLMTPGCTRTQDACSFNSMIFVKCFDTSTIIPFPTTCPASEVPAVRGIKFVLFSLAN